MLRALLLCPGFRVLAVPLLAGAALSASVAAARGNPADQAGVPTPSAQRSGNGGDRLETADGTWHPLFPSAGLRSGHSAIYDAARHRMVVFGGGSQCSSEYLNDVWTFTPGAALDWEELVPAGTPPSARLHHTAIYDPERNRMLVFGGWNGSGRTIFDETWELTLGGTPTWTKLFPSGTSPGPRFGHAAIYDPVRDRMLVFGGNSGSFTDTWELTLGGTPTWRGLSPSGAPPQGDGLRAIYDPLRDRMLVCGGNPNDTWELTLGTTPTWTKLPLSGTRPSIAGYHSMIYDPLRDQMVVFGGVEIDYIGWDVNDVWALSLGGVPTWTKWTPSGALPNPRSMHSAIYDPDHDQMLVFGGDHFDFRPLTWALTLGANPEWNQFPFPARLPPLSSATGVYDPSRDQVLIFGGNQGGVVVNDSWILSLAGEPTWTKLSPSGNPPSKRHGHTAIYDPGRDRMVVFGSSSLLGNDTWALSLGEAPAWMEQSPSGVWPRPRWGHTAIYDPVRDRMIVFGGYDNTDRLNDTWELTLGSNPTWRELSTSGTRPSARMEHAAIYDPIRDRMVIFGGEYRNDTWELTLGETPTWTELSPSGEPPGARRAHKSIYDPIGDRMIVFGGQTVSGEKDDTWALSLGAVSSWTRLSPSGGPPGGGGWPTAIYDPHRDRMLIFGSGSCGDTWALEWNRQPTAVVGLLDLQAHSRENNIEILWSITSSAEYVGFHVLRSEAGGAFERVTESMLTKAFGSQPAMFSWTDETVDGAVDYAYRIQGIHQDGTVEAWGRTVTARTLGRDPFTYSLRLVGSNPVPARQGVQFQFDLPKPGAVFSIDVVDVSGRRIAQLLKGYGEAGTHAGTWAGAEPDRLAAGIYFLRLQVLGKSITRKMVLIR